MKVVVSGGGTGGHIYPALAIAKGLTEVNPEARLLYIGTDKGLEAGIVSQTGIPFRTVTVEGLPRKIGLQLFSSLLKMTRGFMESWRLLKEFQPDLVIGTGGYVCGPVVLAAALQNIPTMIHEQNAFPGVTNKVLSLVVKRVAATFPESVRHFKKKDKVVVTGLPVRPEVLTAKPDEALPLGFLAGHFNILVVGGSRGARTINQAMVEVIRHYGKKAGVRLLIVSGEAGYEELRMGLEVQGIALTQYDNIRVLPYLHEMPAALAAADLIICRAGATTIAEITVRGIASVLVPYPYAAENHQEHNAKALVDKGAALMIADNEFTGIKAIEEIEKFRNNPGYLKEMGDKARILGKPDALQNIITLAQNLLS